MDNQFSKEVKMFMVFDMLGDLVRTGPLLWHVKRERLEDVKDHVIDLILILKLLKRYFPVNLDYDKMNDYILFHDLPEVITGDITKFEGISSSEKKRVTNIATHYLATCFKDIFDIETIICNYEEQADLEAKIVYMLDKVHSSSTFIKYESERHIDVNDKRIISELRHLPFVEDRINKGMDVADIFYEYHLNSVNISDEECNKYGITRGMADWIVWVIRNYLTEMYKQKLEGTLLHFNDGFPCDAMIYNKRRHDSAKYIHNKLIKDTSPEERKKELVDKLELFRAMAEDNGFTLQDILDEVDKKKENNGVFTRKLLLEKVDKYV